MKQIPLGGSGWMVPAVVVGCMRLGELDSLAEQYHTTSTTIAAAWILRHPVQMQLITGTARESRLKEIIQACEVRLTREEWYRLYLAAGHPLP